MSLKDTMKFRIRKQARVARIALIALAGVGKRELVFEDSQFVLQYSQFAVESMLAFVDFEAILEEQFGLLSGGAQCGIFVSVAGSQNGAGQALQTILQFRDSLDDLWSGRLRLDVGVEGNFAFDLFNVFTNRAFAVVHRVNDLRNDAG